MENFGIEHHEILNGTLQYKDKADLKRQLTKLADLMPDNLMPGGMYIGSRIKSECQCPGECVLETLPDISPQVFDQPQDGHNASHACNQLEKEL